MTIEERAMQKWGITDNPELCAWMTADGTMINGSYEGFQRDRDHREISEFYKHSRRGDSGSSTVYLEKFERRGNIRVGCNGCGYYFELCGMPTKEQIDRIYTIWQDVQFAGVPFGIGKRDRRRFWAPATVYSMEEYLDHLNRYGNGRYGYCLEQMRYAVAA